MAFHGTGSYEQRLGNLAVGEPGGGQFGDTPLAGGEGFEPGKPGASRLRPRGSQLGLGTPGQGVCTEMMADVDGLAQWFSGCNSMVCAAQERAQIGLGASSLEASVGPSEDLDSFT
jgi:hypothetical protein